MAGMTDAINLKRKMYFEHEGVPYHCLDKEISTPTARGGQTLVRLKMRNLLTRAVFDKTFKADDKFKEPDLEDVEATYLYADADGAYFLDQTTFETLQLNTEMLADALDWLLDGTIVQIEKYQGNPIGIQVPMHVELVVAETEPGFKGDTATGTTYKPAKLETGVTVQVPAFVKEGDKIKVATESKEFAGRV